MTLDQWLDAQRFPNGFECVGREALGRMTRDLIRAEREALAAWLERQHEARKEHDNIALCLAVQFRREFLP
jgi:hypothetical protein